MKSDYTEGGTGKVRMIYYIDEIINALDKAEPRGLGIKTSAAPECLYKVDEDFEKLSLYKAKMFHDIVAKTLYTTKRSSPDTCTSVAFIIIRVRDPKKHCWRNIVHIINYIKGTRDIPFILRYLSHPCVRIFHHIVPRVLLSFV